MESLLPVFKGESPPPRSKPLFWQWSRGKAVRDGRWKAVTNGDAWELYDMEADRTEVHDLAEQHPERVQQMATQWEEWYASTGS